MCSPPPAAAVGRRGSGDGDGGDQQHTGGFQRSEQGHKLHGTCTL